VVNARLGGADRSGRKVARSSSNATVIRKRLNDGKPFPLSGWPAGMNGMRQQRRLRQVAPIPSPKSKDRRHTELVSPIARHAKLVPICRYIGSLS